MITLFSQVKWGRMGATDAGRLIATPEVCVKTYSFSLSKHKSDVKCLTLKFVVCQLKKKKDTPSQGLNFIAAIAVEGEQNAVDYCGNDSNFLPYSVIFILF